MTDEDLVKNLAWFRQEAGLESAYPVTHPMSMFIRAIAARERLKKREWVGLTDDQKLSLEIQGGESDVMLAELVESWLKEKNT